MTPASEATPLSDDGLLRAWEEGATADALERPLVLLRRAGLVPSGEQPERWPIGRRDRELIALHAATFGAEVVGTMPCPSCREPLEMEFELDTIRSASGDTSSRVEIDAPGGPLIFRLPTTQDLRRSAACTSAENAAAALAQACLYGHDERHDSLSGVLLDAVSEAMAAEDPQAQVQLQTRCPGCREEVTVAFDIADYVWRQIARTARSLLGDVHVLASAYGWSERDILSMPAARRQRYMEMVLD